MNTKERDWFDKLYNSLYTDVYKYVRCLLWFPDNTSDVENCVQDIFLTAIQNSRKLSAMSMEECRYWILSVAHHKVFSMNRQLSRQYTKEMPLDWDKIIAYIDQKGQNNDNIQDWEEQIIWREGLQRIRDKLPRRHQELFDYLYVYQFDDEKIYVLLGLTQSALRMRKIRLEKRMKKIIGNLKKNFFQ